MRTQNMSRVSKKQRLVWLLLLAIVVAVALIEVPRGCGAIRLPPAPERWRMEHVRIIPTATEQA